MSRRAQSTVGQCSNPTQKVFLVQLTLHERDRIDAWELCREIERLGGVETRDGFAFTTGARREAALEMLAERYEARCFQQVNGRVAWRERNLAEEVVATQ